MSLYDLAVADHARIVNDPMGFSRLVTLTNPEGVSALVPAIVADIGQTVDPETGAVITGRRVTAQFLTAPLRTAGLGEPRAVADSGMKPWRVQIPDAQGILHSYKVREAMPDATLGRVDCLLEAYRSGP